MSCIMFWSSGKDSAQALWELRQAGSEVAALLTTYSEATGRVPFHEVPIELAAAQAGACGLPHIAVALPSPCGNAVYTRLVQAALQPWLGRISSLCFADLYLEDIRSFREQQFASLNIELRFPLWGRDTAALAQLISSTHKAVVTCVDSEILEPGLCGASYDSDFISRLPAAVDPCGEGGEFHTFVYDSPLFSAAIGLELTELQSDGRFVWRCPRALSQ